MSLVCDDPSPDPASSAANAAWCLGIELLALEWRLAGVRHGLLRRVVGNAVADQQRALLVILAVDDDVLVILRQQDVRIGVQLVNVLVAAPDPDQPRHLGHENALLERLQEVFVRARLQLLVLLEGRQRLLGRDQDQGNLAQTRAATQLVGDRVPDLARFDAQDDHCGLVGAAPLHGIVAIRNGFDLEALWLQQTLDLIRRVVIRFDCERDSIGHLVS